MSSITLTDQFLAKIAGWDVVKQARRVLASGKVLSSNWAPPILRGVVQEGNTSYRAGLVIKDNIDIENLCSCRASRGWGTICVHSIAVGLHHLRSLEPATLVPSTAPVSRAVPVKTEATATSQKRQSFRRIRQSESGILAEIHVIIPPNFAPALAKAKAMVVLEASWQSRRSPLNALPEELQFRFNAQDNDLLDFVEDLAAETPAMLILSQSDLASLLDKLVDHPNVTLGKTHPLKILQEPLKLGIIAQLAPTGEITFKLKTPLATQLLIRGAHDWTFTGTTFQRIFLPALAKEIISAPVKIDRARIPLFLSQDWPQLAANADVEANFKIEDFSLVAAQPRISLFLTGGLASLQAELSFDYSGKKIVAGQSSAQESIWIPDPISPTRYATRDFSLEQLAISRLVRNGFTGPHTDGKFQLAGQNLVLTFFAREFYRLQKEWNVSLEERLEKSATHNLERIEPEFQITPSGQRWFDLDVAFKSSSGDRFSNADIQRLILSGQNHTRLSNGKIALIDTGAVEELQEVLLDCAPEQHEGVYRIQNVQAGFLASALNQQQNWKITAPVAWRDRATKLYSQADLEIPPLGALEKLLRPYQTHGVAWMHFLRRNGFGGILADEMGLGKTLQTLAYLQTVRNHSQGRGGPSLVVCPTSLVFNWMNEAAKFTPEIRTLALQGTKRHESFDSIPSADLVITSYALIRRDLDQYRKHEFDTVILDEAQHIKNRQTQNAQSVKSIRARNRLVLTGTPIENSVLDLWSIFDFLMPGYLGSATDFRERYEQPIAREKNSEAQSRLNRRIRPFILRRLKKEVTKDLPDKIEQVSYCELTDDQQAVYEQLLNSSREKIADAAATQGLQRSRMIMLNALLRLRQVCCDLRLLKLNEVDPAKASAKVDLFNELLQEIIDGGHRALVFSQFVEMLSLLKEKLVEQNIEFSYLDGSTMDRGKVVHEFQSGKNPVFLISLKAGGVGLNLTAADTVIHFDPWWNPAVEDQATDRAHRIGQKNVVTSYKLITRGTVEEKILNLQNKKRELIQATLGNEEEFASSLTAEELRSLFE